MKLNFAKHRATIRLPDYDYSQIGGYFLTICTHERQNLFGYVRDGNMYLNEAGKAVEEVWGQLVKKFPEIHTDQFIVMPNHFHGVVLILNQKSVGAIHELPLQGKAKPSKLPLYQYSRRIMLLPRIVGFFKMNSAKRVNHIRKVQGCPVWQRNYYEHIIRNEDALGRIRQYICNNPLTWELDKENLQAKSAHEFYQWLEKVSRIRWIQTLKIP